VRITLLAGLGPAAAVAVAAGELDAALPLLDPHAASAPTSAAVASRPSARLQVPGPVLMPLTSLVLPPLPA
jgi:hypothetical protein